MKIPFLLRDVAISTSSHVLFRLLYKHQTPLPLRRLYYQPNEVLQKASDTQQLIDDINQRILYDKYFFQSSFHEKALRFSQIFIFCFHRDNFI